jgi:hypothetical protein
MEVDPTSLDPEERMNKFYALFSIGFGVISLCAAVIPICGGTLALLGIGTGVFGRRSDSKTMATIGIGISVLGMLIAIVYAVFLFIVSN